jgi:hypothetical protein
MLTFLKNENGICPDKLIPVVQKGGCGLMLMIEEIAHGRTHRQATGYKLK